ILVYRGIPGIPGVLEDYSKRTIRRKEGIFIPPKHIRPYLQYTATLLPNGLIIYIGGHEGWSSGDIIEY
ncbi:14257_t:CDS:2, partial [Dentiscutata erythropus]